MKRDDYKGPSSSPPGTHLMSMANCGDVLCKTVYAMNKMLHININIFMNINSRKREKRSWNKAKENELNTVATPSCTFKMFTHLCSTPFKHFYIKYLKLKKMNCKHKLLRKFCPCCSICACPF